MKAVEDITPKEPEVVELSKRESLDLLKWLEQIKSLDKDLQNGKQIMELMLAGLREKYGVEETWIVNTREGILIPPKKEDNGK
jgi:surfactin synthase thioesterase subunit|tara:strand:- start:360 stop:608 length:249 start_codon:yes stop_codon:yes gene_type:complete